MATPDPTPGATRRAWLCALGLVVGMALVVRATAEVIYRRAGYEPGLADCDDCGITILLDGLGWFAAAVVGYLLVAWWVWRRTRRRGNAGH